MKFGVIGAGQMGGGIAHVSALSGYDVRLSDISEDALKRAIDAAKGAGVEKVGIVTDGMRAAAGVRPGGGN